MNSKADRLHGLSTSKRQLLARWRQGESVPRDARLPKRPEDASVALSPSQMGMWLTDRLHGPSPLYNLPVAYRIRGHLHDDALRRALAAIVERHEALRTSIKVVDDIPTQVVADRAELSVDVVELESGSMTTSERVLHEAREFVRTTFDLARGPLVRVRLYRAADDDHLLVVVVHHLVADGWSLGVLVAELSALYRAELSGVPARLPPLTVQPADVTHWQLVDPDHVERASRDLDHWAEVLEGADVLRLPTDRPRPPVFDSKGGVHRLHLDPDLVERLRAFAATRNLSPFVPLLAAFAVVLHRFAGQDDLVIGTAAANRRRPETEALVGMLVNTLPLRLTISGGVTMEQVISMAAAVTRDAFAHQDAPFDRIVQRVQPERSLDHAPLVQVMLVLQNAPLPPLELAGADVTRVPIGTATSKWDLALFLVPDDGALDVEVEYGASLFAADTIERLTGAFRRCIETTIARPDTPVGELPLRDEPEQADAVGAFNDTAEDLSGWPDVVRGCLDHAARSPSSVAIMSGNECLTYGEVARRTALIAAALREVGVRRGDRVGVCTDRSAMAALGPLAVWRAGGVYVPIDSAQPAARAAMIIEDAAPVALLTDAVGSATLPSLDVPVVDLTSLVDGPALSDEAAPDDHDAAYIIFTSGSTGRPKGVHVSHGALRNHLFSFCRASALQPGERLLATVPLGFDVSIADLVMPLQTGATVVVAPSDLVRDGERLAAALDEGTVDVVQATPSTWRLLVAGGWEGRRSLRAFVGGEAVPRDLAEAIVARSARLQTVYGPTEATIWTCSEPVVPDDSTPSTVPIAATPWANVRHHVLDAACQPVPVGFVGELFIAGELVADGYLNLPRLTAERFVPDAFTDRPGQRMFATGDLVRRRRDGRLDFLGRADDQVKINGHRIELAEVEQALVAHPHVTGAAVIAWPAPGGGQRLAAYVTADLAGAAGALENPNRLDEWHEVWSASYENLHAFPDPLSCFLGWRSSASGEPIAAEQMRTWAEEVAQRIRSLAPKGILEIGCGSGLVLFRVARGCERYVGTDVSAAALEYIRAHAANMPTVKVFEAAADGLADSLFDGIDTVVLNSVIQYFPDPAYLELVLASCVARLPRGGRLFLGDVRDADTLDELHRGLAAEVLGADADPAALEREARRRRWADDELALSPRYLASLVGRLDRIAAVDILPKELPFDNEISQFRYDAVLHLDAIPNQPLSTGVASQSWPRPEPTLHVAPLDTCETSVVNAPLHNIARRQIPAELHRHVSKALPRFMVPATIMVLDGLPLNANNKIDRRRFPPPEPVERADIEHVGPATDLERRIGAIWNDVLGCGDVGVTADFFTLGGQSLLANQVAARIRREFGVPLPLTSFFARPTVRGLADEVEQASIQSRPAEIPGGDTRREAPLSAAQRRLWFLELLGLAGAAYHIVAVFDIEGALDINAVRDATALLCTRQRALRTVICSDGGIPRQIVREHIAPVLTIDDLRPVEDVASVVADILRREADTPFDLETGPLLRLRLLRQRDDRAVVALTVHHLVADGWSLALMAGEFSAFYRALTTGVPADLAPLRIGYLDYATWLDELIESGALAGQEAYWKEQLAGAPRLLELPTDRPRPPVATGAGADIPVRIPAGIVRAVRNLARRTGATPFMVLLAAFDVQLARVSGQTDIVVGTPTANRNHPEVEPLVGMFVNTLVLRAEVDELATFADLVTHVRATALDAYTHSDLPFERLVELLQPERDLGRSPLFQVFFTLQNTARAELELPHVRVRLRQADTTVAKFDLSLELADDGDEVGGRLEYRTDLFDHDTATELAHQYVDLLDQLTTRPDVCMLDVELPAPDQVAVLDGGPLVQPGPIPDDVVAALRRHAALHPDRSAIGFHGRSTTYRELDERVEALSARLRSAGIGPGSLVGVYLGRGPALVEAIHAILRTGGAYVPLDEHHPVERLTMIAHDAGLDTVLVDDLLTVPPLLRETVPLVLAVDDDRDRRDDDSPPRACEAVDPASVAYVIYTSGSTGRPKGVAVEHAALTNFVAAIAMRPGMGPDDRVLAITTPSFDISVLELVAPLALGATIVLADALEAADPHRLIGLLGRTTVSVAQATPTTWRLLDDAGWTPPQHLRVLIGGEPVPSDLAQRLAGNAREVWNMYGPTEATVWVSAQPVPTQRAVTTGVEPIGGVLPGMDVRILDRWGRPVTTNGVGELHIGGAGLARGYWGRPDLTADRFIPDAGGRRLYRTGDMCRWRGGTTLEFLGRCDHQVKLRGHRIELGEIESALRDHPSVSDAVAVLQRDEHRHDELVAYVTMRPGELPVDGNQVRRALRDRLAPYMVPIAVVVLDQLPRTPNSKIDRAALPLFTPGGNAGARVGFTTAAEHAVSEVWADVLGHREFGAEDNFFDVGGQSLLVVRVVDALRELCNRNVDVIDVFAHPTPRALASFIDDRTSFPDALDSARRRAARRRAVPRGRRS